MVRVLPQEIWNKVALEIRGNEPPGWQADLTGMLGASKAFREAALDAWFVSIPHRGNGVSSRVQYLRMVANHPTFSKRVRSVTIQSSITGFGRLSCDNGVCLFGDSAGFHKTWSEQRLPEFKELLLRLPGLCEIVFLQTSVSCPEYVPYWRELVAACPRIRKVEYRSERIDHCPGRLELCTDNRRLRELRIHCAWNGVLRLESFEELPALEYLSIGPRRENWRPAPNEPESGPMSLHFGTTAFPSLSTLELNDVKIEASDVEQWLKNEYAPKLSSLKLKRVFVKSGFWREIFRAISDRETLLSVRCESMHYHHLDGPQPRRFTLSEGDRDVYGGTVSVFQAKRLSSLHWEDLHHMGDMLRAVHRRNDGQKVSRFRAQIVPHESTFISLVPVEDIEAGRACFGMGLKVDDWWMRPEEDGTPLFHLSPEVSRTISPVLTRAKLAKKLNSAAVLEKLTDSWDA